MFKTWLRPWDTLYVNNPSAKLGLHIYSYIYLSRCFYDKWIMAVYICGVSEAACVVFVGKRGKPTNSPSSLCSLSKDIYRWASYHM